MGRNLLAAGALGILTLATSVVPARGVESAAPKVSESLLQLAEADGSARVIVQLQVGWSPEADLPGQRQSEQRQAIESAQRAVLEALTDTGATLVRNFAAIPFQALRVTPAALTFLESSPLVTNVQEDALAEPFLAESGPLVQADQAWAAGYDGTGKMVAILDTGVDKSHAFFGGRVVAEACFSGNSNCPNSSTTQVGTGAGVPCTYEPDGCGHGTHVAGITAGSGTGFSGIAKGAQILAIQVFSRFTGATCAGGPDPCTRTYTSDQIAALEHVYSLRNSFSIASVNMSLGGGRFTASCDATQAATKAAIDNLRGVGIATVIASGNNGFVDAISAPACISTAISVGSTDKGDEVSLFSNSASFLSLLATGESINSSVPGGSFAFNSGTSMAAPHVAGAWAILKQKSPAATVPQLLSALANTGLPVLDPGNGLTKPRIRIKGALDTLVSLSVSTTTVAAGGTVNVTVSGGPGNVRDWIGLYVPTAVENGWIDWKYLSGTRTPPPTGLTSATVAFTMPATAGTYQFRFFPNESFNRLATSENVTVQPPTVPLIQVTPTSLPFGSVNAGAARDLTMTVKNVGVGTLAGDATVSGSAFSVVGTASYSLAANQTAVLTVRFAPLVGGPASGTLTLTGGGGATVPLSGTGVASPAVTVLGPTTLSPGASVQVQVANGPGNPRDWVGLHAIGATDMGWVDWKFLSGTRTPPTTGLTSAVITFTMPTTQGTYNFRFFQNNTYTKLATSATVTVQATDPLIQATPTSLAFGSVSAGNSRDLTVTVKNVGVGTLAGDATVTGTGFSLIGTSSYSLGPNATTALTVRFTPLAAGTVTGSLSLTGGGGATVALSGTGTVTPALTVVGATTVAPGASVQVQVSNGPGYTKDWVGLHATSAADAAWIDWKFLSGTRTAPTIGLNAATLTFTMPLAQGTYNFRFFQNNTYTKLATSVTVTVQQPSPSLTVSTTTATPGQVIQVVVANGPGAPKDWVAMHTVAAANTVFLDWKYLNGTRSSTVGFSTATLNFTMPSTPGTYNFRFFSNNSYTRLATSPTVTVSTPSLPPSITVSATTATPGQSIQVTVANGPGNVKDWLAMHGAAAADTVYLDWKYLNGTRTPPVTGVTGATLSFTVPMTPGTYNFRFFQNNTYTKLATSPTVIVSTPGANDNFANRIPLGNAAVSTVGVNGAATKEMGEPDHAGNAGGKSVWWSWTAPTSDLWWVTTNGSGFDTLLGVYTGSSVDTLTLVASEDDDFTLGSRQSRVYLYTVAGTTYQIAVDGAGGLSGNITLAIDKDMDNDGVLDGHEAAFGTSPLNRDTDGDFLLDGWEIYGKNEEDLAAAGASPRHKDIFVEMDYMVKAAASNGLGTNAAVNAGIVASFSAAPLNNPDGVTGIRIHLVQGNEVLYDGDLAPYMTEFGLIKQAHFDPRRAAVYHYMVWADRYAGGTSSGVSMGIPATDFLVTLGAFNSGAGGTDSQKIGTFIHELGHNLGLRHGGNEDTNYKPNYLSVMNYHWQFSGVYRDGTAGHYDYQRIGTNALDENSLNEPFGLNTVGAVGYQTARMCPDGFFYLTPTIPIDWNCNGSTNEPTVMAETNGDGLFQVLGSQDNWANIDFGGPRRTLGPSASPQTILDEIQRAYRPLPSKELDVETYEDLVRRTR